MRLYHDLTTAAWLDEDAAEPEAAFDAVDRQSWAWPGWSAAPHWRWLR